MNARTQPPAGWVTVAAAAAALSKAGDQIDASNVSRYLARFPELPQVKAGKFRYLDLAALAAHRSGNVLVVEKRDARDLGQPVADAPLFAPRPSAPPAPRADDDWEDEAAGAKGGSEISEANLILKRQKIREGELDLAEREGRLVKAEEVLTLLTMYGATLVGELERQEALLATGYGREVAAEVRKGRKAAQAAAAKRLVELAKKHLPGPLAAQVVAPAETDAD